MSLVMKMGTDKTKQVVNDEVFQHWKAEIDIPGLLYELGEDFEREGLQDTPRRVMKAW